MTDSMVQALIQAGALGLCFFIIWYFGQKMDNFTTNIGLKMDSLAASVNQFTGYLKAVTDNADDIIREIKK